VVVPVSSKNLISHPYLAFYLRGDGTVCDLWKIV
jgi:hypothetical protein